MPSNAQMFSDYYANSVVSYWDKQRTEARALLIQERGDQSAYIKSLESAIRAADDDIRGWAQVSDARERATRQSIIQSQRARASSARARSRASRSAIRGATDAMTKVESRLAQSSTGQAETASAFERAQGRNIPDDQMILSLTSQMGGVGTDLAKDIAKYSLERGGSADEATRLAASHGIRRTLRETARRNPGAGINENVINGTALNLVGLDNTPANRAKIGTYNAMVQAEGDRAARTVQSAPTGSAGAVQVADDLEARGFAPFDFLPEMEVDALKARREKMQADLATAQAQRAEGSDLDAMLQQEMVKRTQGVGQGLQYGGGLLGAMRFGAHNKRRAEAANASLAAAQADSNRLNAMSENERLVYRATAKARQSYNRFGSSMPDGANETLWQLAGQVAKMNKRGGFANMDKMVQQVRLLIADTPEGGLKDMSPEQKQVALDQLLEFASMQQLEGWEAPQPAFRGESEAFAGREIEEINETQRAKERIDPSERLRNETQRAKERGGSRSDINESGKKAAVRVAELEIERTQPTKDPRIVEGERLLRQRRRNLGRIKRDPNSSKTKITVAQKDVDEAKQQLDQIQEEIDAASYWDSASTGGGFGQDYDELLRKTRRGISSTHGSRVDKNAQPNPRKTPGRAAGTGGAIGVPGRVATNVFEKNMGRTITVADMAIAINEAIAAGETPPYISASTRAQNAGTFGNMFDPGGSAYSASPQEKRLRQAETLAKQARGGSEATQTQLESDVWNSRNDYFGDLMDANLSGELDQDTLLLDAVDR